MDDTANRLAPVHEVLGNILKAFDEFCLQHDLCYWVDGGTLLGAVRHGGFIPWDDDVDICMPRKDYNRLIDLHGELPQSLEFEHWTADPKAFRLFIRIRHRHSKVMEPGVKDPKGIFIDVQAMDNYNPDGSLPRGFYWCKKLFGLGTLNRWHVYKGQSTGLKYTLLKLVRLLLYLPNKYYPQWHVKLFKNKVAKWTSLSEKLETNRLGYGYENPWTVWYEREWLLPVHRIDFEGFPVNSPADEHAYLLQYYGDGYMTPLPESQRHTHFMETIIDDPKV